MMLYIVSSPTLAEEPLPTAMIRSSGNTFPNIRFTDQPLRIRGDGSGNARRVHALAHATTTTRNLTVIDKATGRPVAVTAGKGGVNHIMGWVRIERSETPVEWLISEAGGIRRSLRFVVETAASSPRARPSRKSQTMGTEPKETVIDVGLGGTHVSYDQTGFTSFSGFTPTAKISLSLRLSERLRTGFSTFVNLLPIATPSPTATLRFLGVNARLGWDTPVLPSPWGLSVAVGAYYFTMMGTNNQFGIANTLCLQLFPVLRLRLAPRHSVQSYFKYAPILTESGISPSNRELAYGASWTYALENGHPLTTSLDISSLRFSIGDIEAAMGTVSLGLSYGL